FYRPQRWTSRWNQRRAQHAGSTGPAVKVPQSAPTGPRDEGVPVLLDLVEQFLFAAMGALRAPAGQHMLAVVGQFRRVPLEVAHRLLGSLPEVTGPLPGLGASAQRGEHVHLVP